MSDKTSGEDTKRLELETYSALQIAVYAVNCSNSDGDIEYVRHAIQSAIDQELASLREQLEVLTNKLIFADKNCELLRGHRDELELKLKQKEDENRELRDTLSKCHKSLCTYGEHPLIDSWVKKALSNLSA